MIKWLKKLWLLIRKPKVIIEIRLGKTMKQKLVVNYMEYVSFISDMDLYEFDTFPQWLLKRHDYIIYDNEIGKFSDE